MSEPDRHGRGVRIGKLESKNNRGPGAFIGQGVDVSIEHAELSGNTGGGIIIGSDAVGQLSLLGLPSSMPGLDVAELLQALRDAHGNSGDERRAIIRRSTAWAWIAKVADVDAVMHTLLQVASSSHVHTVIQRLLS